MTTFFFFLGDVCCELPDLVFLEDFLLYASDGGFGWCKMVLLHLSLLLALEKDLARCMSFVVAWVSGFQLEIRSILCEPSWPSIALVVAASNQLCGPLAQCCVNQSRLDPDAVSASAKECCASIV